MKELTLNMEQIGLIHHLIKLPSIQIIWDINAFYINTDSETYKLECLDESPEGSINTYDEIFYCQFTRINERIEFEKNNPKYWYKIISNDCKIIDIQYLNVIELYPDNKLIPIEKELNNTSGLNKSTLGLIIETDKGYLPAFLLPSNSGFQWQPKFDFYSKTEIDNLIIEKIKYCEIKNCA
jgi:hypothetical protein